MTDIEKKALALVNEVSDGFHDVTSIYNIHTAKALRSALCRAIEQHEAFRQEVSDAVEKLLSWPSIRSQGIIVESLAHFTIAKPVDPFVALVGEAVWNDPNEPDAVDCAASILAALAARGLEIREVGHD